MRRLVRATGELHGHEVRPIVSVVPTHDEMREMSREGKAPRLVEPEEMVPPLLYVVSREADRVNGMRFDANAWDPALPPAEAARRAGRPAGFVFHPQE